jgi:ribonuclease E
MAKTSEVAAPAAVPSSADIDRAAKFAREPFLLDGEGPEALAPGTARRRALDAALAEIDGGAEEPSIQWRRDFSLLLGLERLLADEPPKLRDGAELNPHQVDALSGTLTELMAEQQVAADGEANGKAKGNGSVAATEKAAPIKKAAKAEADDGEVELDDEDEELAPDEEPQDWEEQPTSDDEETIEEAPDDPGAERRFWFEHATGAGKTVAAVGFIDATRTGGVLILTHRRNLVDQFIGEISDRGYKERLRPPLLGDRDDPDGPVTVETYQWFVRNHKKISDAYSIVICDEAHTALGEKTSACIRAWTGPVFIGMTATGALIARHVADLFPTQTSRFDLIQAARRGVISPLRCMRIPPGPGVRTIAKVPLRKGEVDQDFDQEELAALLDQEPFNVAIADLYKTRFDGMPGVLYTAGVQHAKNVARALQAAGVTARAVSGETPKRELAEILAGFERGEVDVLCNAMLLAEGWNSPRATICMHLAPTASRRIYQQRVGRVTRRAPGKEAGLVIDFVHPATTHDETRARARAQGARGAADRAGLRRRGEADGGAGTGDLADRRREPRLSRAARLGGAGRGPGQHPGLAAGAGDASE